jgi:hypothetical protein
MEFNIRLLNDSDYDNIIFKWWKDWGGEAPPKDSLPLNGIGGFMVSKGDIDICAGFAYFTNSSIAFCEFVISNFNYREKDRKQAIETLINTISEASLSAGYKYMLVSSFNKNLVKRYEACGYIKTQEDCVEMIKKL